MAELLLINPGRKVAKKTRKSHRSAAQRRATAKLVAMNKARRGRKARRANPIGGKVRRVARRAAHRTYSAVRRIRRRRNPIGIGSASSYVGMFKDAMIDGAGAVAMDVGFGYVNGMLPASMQRTAGSLGVGDAVKAIFSVAVGKLLNRATRGLSMRAARGALTVQMADIVRGFVPASLPMGGRLGYTTAAPVINASARVGPNGVGRVGAYVQPGATALLNGPRGNLGAYMPPGVTAMLSGGAAAREGWGNRR